MPERFCPHIAFPSYAYVPGKNKHPVDLFVGLWPTCSSFDQSNWSNNTAYLLGFDLYHHGFYWETHVVWEDLWHLCKKKQGPAGPLLQGLIFLAAAQLKWLMEQTEQTQRMYSRALELIDETNSVGNQNVLGIDLRQLKNKIQHNLDLVKKDQAPPPLVIPLSL